MSEPMDREAVNVRVRAALGTLDSLDTRCEATELELELGVLVRTLRGEVAYLDERMVILAVAGLVGGV